MTVVQSRGGAVLVVEVTMGPAGLGALISEAQSSGRSANLIIGVRTIIEALHTVTNTDEEVLLEHVTGMIRLRIEVAGLHHTAEAEAIPRAFGVAGVSIPVLETGDTITRMPLRRVSEARLHT